MSEPSIKPILEARNLTVHRNEKLVLSVDHLDVREGEILAVIGPNGAGKSTLLLALAQLLKPSSGEIYFRGKLLKNRDDLSYRRKIALVLQDPLLLDTSVIENVTTGLRFRRIPRKDANVQVQHWIKRLGIDHLVGRKAHQLSGGEAQRVNLTRAFALNPEVLFLDEPFGSLDAPTRAGLLSDFHELLTQTQMTTLFITHDLDEALMLGDRVAVIINGELRQVNVPDVVFGNPADADVASLVGVDTILSGQIIGCENGFVRLDVCGIQIEAVGVGKPGQDVIVFLRPEDVTLWREGGLPLSSARNHLAGTIHRMTSQGSLIKIVIKCLGCNHGEHVKIVALVTRASTQEMELSEGVHVTATFKASALHLIPR